MSDEIEASLELEDVGGNEDLSREISRSIARTPLEQVTCRRITRHHYRCNWWALQDTAAHHNPGMQGLMVTTSRICQSQFLHVMKVGGELKIRVVSK